MLGCLQPFLLLHIPAAITRLLLKKKNQTHEAHAKAEENNEVKVVKASFTNVDAAVADHIKKLADNYLQLKNALTNTKPTEAGDAAKKITGSNKRLR